MKEKGCSNLALDGYHILSASMINAYTQLACTTKYRSLIRHAELEMHRREALRSLLGTQMHSLVTHI